MPKAKAQDLSKGPQQWTTAKVTAARVTSLLGRVTKGLLLSVGALTVAGVTGASLVLQVGSTTDCNLVELSYDRTDVVAAGRSKGKTSAT